MNCCLCKTRVTSQERQDVRHLQSLDELWHWKVLKLFASLEEASEYIEQVRDLVVCKTCWTETDWDERWFALQAPLAAQFGG